MERQFIRGMTPFRGLTITMVINYLLTGMILQVAPLNLVFFFVLFNYSSLKVKPLAGDLSFAFFFWGGGGRKPSCPGVSIFNPKATALMVTAACHHAKRERSCLTHRLWPIAPIEAIEVLIWKKNTCRSQGKTLFQLLQTELLLDLFKVMF